LKGTSWVSDPTQLSASAPRFSADCCHLNPPGDGISKTMPIFRIAFAMFVRTFILIEAWGQNSRRGSPAVHPLHSPSLYPSTASLPVLLPAYCKVSERVSPSFFMSLVTSLIFLHLSLFLFLNEFPTFPTAFGKRPLRVGASTSPF